MITNKVNVVRYLVSGNSYPITYGYWDKEEIRVYLTKEDNTIITLTLGTDYTLTDPNGTNGTLTKVSDWGSATKITILRSVPLTQERDLVNGQTLDAETIEAALDHAIAAIQQLEEEQSRSLKTAVDEEGLDITFPDTEARKGTGSGTVICFDSTGKIIVLRDLAQFDSDVASTQTNAGIAAAAASGAEASEAKAGKWAENPEDTPVESGKYSAKHHAAKAKASEDVAIAKASEAGDSEVAAAASALAASLSEGNAHDSEVAAKGYKEGAEAVNEIASEYARGKKVNGTDVVPGEPGYHDNAQYYKDQAASSASDASTAKTNAQNAAAAAAQSKADAEAAYQLAHQEGISDIVNNKGAEYNTISIIQRDGTTHTFSVVNGSKGDKGDKGDPGESGVVTPVGAFFTLSVDADGDLWVTYPDGGTPPDFYYDSDTGDLYVDTE